MSLCPPAPMGCRAMFDFVCHSEGHQWWANLFMSLLPRCVGVTPLQWGVCLMALAAVGMPQLLVIALDQNHGTSWGPMPPPIASDANLEMANSFLGSMVNHNVGQELLSMLLFRENWAGKGSPVDCRVWHQNKGCMRLMNIAKYFSKEPNIDTCMTF